MAKAQPPASQTPIPPLVRWQFRRAFLSEDLVMLRAIMDEHPHLDLINPELSGYRKSHNKFAQTLMNIFELQEYPLALLDHNTHPGRRNGLGMFSDGFIRGYLALVAEKGLDMHMPVSRSGYTMLEQAWNHCNVVFGAQIVLEHLRRETTEGREVTINMNLLLCTVAPGPFADMPGSSRRDEAIERLIAVHKQVRVWLNRPQTQQDRELAKALGRNSFFRKPFPPGMMNPDRYAKPSAALLALYQRFRDVSFQQRTLPGGIEERFSETGDVFGMELGHIDAALRTHERAAFDFYRKNPDKTQLPQDFSPVPLSTTPSAGDAPRARNTLSLFSVRPANGQRSQTALNRNRLH